MRTGRTWRATLLGTVVLGAMALGARWSGLQADPPKSAQDSSVERGTVEGTSDRAAHLDLKTRRSIDRGYQWLQRAIHWNGTVSTERDGQPDLACTSIVGLALLSEGSTPRVGRYARESERVLHGVLDLIQVRFGGPPSEVTLVQRKIGRNADLFLAAIYLSEVYYEAPGWEREIRAALQKLVQKIGDSQGRDGTWGSDSWAPILGTVLGWESLRTASSAGLKVEGSSEKAGAALLAKLGEPPSEQESWMHAFYKEASSLRVLYSLDYRNDPRFERCVQKLLDTTQSERQVFAMAGGEEYLSFYLVTECLIQNPRPAWKAWYPQVRDRLVEFQNQDGSWTGHHCITDRTFCTAAALLTLVAPQRQLSISDL